MQTALFLTFVRSYARRHTLAWPTGRDFCKEEPVRYIYNSANNDDVYKTYCFEWDGILNTCKKLRCGRKKLHQTFSISHLSKLLEIQISDVHDAKKGKRVLLYFHRITQ